MLNLWIAIIMLVQGVQTPGAIRDVRATSCDVIRLNVAIGMTSQIIFEQPPTLTLHADTQHFQIKTNGQATRSLAIIPFVTPTEIEQLFFRPGGEAPLVPSGNILARRLDAAFKTNLFVFFKNSNQLMFELRFVDKTKADYIVRVHQVFTKECQL